MRPLLCCRGKALIKNCRNGPSAPHGNNPGSEVSVVGELITMTFAIDLQADRILKKKSDRLNTFPISSKDLEHFSSKIVDMTS